MSSNRAVVSTGDETLNAMIGGGVPAERAVLVTGGPGTGKSTMAMQFLQAGLDQGDRCLYVSTEQRAPELQDSFAPFGFDLDDDNLAVTSIHARTTDTVEGDRELTLETLDGDDPFGGFAAPFAVEHVGRYLERFAPCDRVVFDSISALSTLQGEENFRRAVLDFIWLFTDEFEATTFLTAEGQGTTDAPVGGAQYSAHGVLKLWREPVEEDVHRYLQVEKLRGVDHDRRTVELEFTDTGVTVSPVRRSQPPAVKQHKHTPIGIEGLDQLTGGGLVTGAGTLLQHDGRVNLSALFSTLLASLHEAGFALTLVPTLQLRPARLAGMLEGYGIDLEQLLLDGDLYVIDFTGAWDAASGRNVYEAGNDLSTLKGVFREVEQMTGGPRATVANADAMAHALGEDDARELRYYQEGQLLDTDDLLIHVQNPDVVPDQMASFFEDTADQVLRTWLKADGLQYLSLRKSPCGFVGTTSLVEYLTEPPYLRVQEPPRSRENPMSE
ncbi:MAG: ATPase domain-containing protein [Halobacteriaceae archaeon]